MNKVTTSHPNAKQCEPKQGDLFKHNKDIYLLVHINGQYGLVSLHDGNYWAPLVNTIELAMEDTEEFIPLPSGTEVRLNVE
jgi:hypothetical protein